MIQGKERINTRNAQTVQPPPLIISHCGCLLARWLTCYTKTGPVKWRPDNTNRCWKKSVTSQTSLIYNSTDFLLLLRFQWVSEKISMAGNNMIHCTVIRDWLRWKEKICSLTRVTHRETQILSKCHQAECSCRGSVWECSQWIHYSLYFHHYKSVKGMWLTEGEKWESKDKSRSQEKCWFISPPIKRVQY